MSPLSHPTGLDVLDILSSFAKVILVEQQRHCLVFMALKETQDAVEAQGWTREALPEGVDTEKKDYDGTPPPSTTSPFNPVPFETERDSPTTECQTLLPSL